MITFVHKKHADKARGRGKIVITYTGFELFLGLILLFTNISAMILIYNYGIHPVRPYQDFTVYKEGASALPNTKK
jgi:hypothetical protein